MQSDSSTDLETAVTAQEWGPPVGSCSVNVVAHGRARIDTLPENRFIGEHNSIPTVTRTGMEHEEQEGERCPGS